MNNKQTIASVITGAISFFKCLFVSDRYEYLPKTHKKNNVLAKVPPHGKIIQLRFYDDNGSAYLDIDFNHHNDPDNHPKDFVSGAHKHIWDHTKDKPRSIPLSLTEEEYEYYVLNYKMIEYTEYPVKLMKNKRKKNIYKSSK